MGYEDFKSTVLLKYGNNSIKNDNLKKLEFNYNPRLYFGWVKGIWVNEKHNYLRVTYYDLYRSNVKTKGEVVIMERRYKFLGVNMQYRGNDVNDILSLVMMVYYGIITVLAWRRYENISGY